MEEEWVHPYAKLTVPELVLVACDGEYQHDNHKDCDWNSMICKGLRELIKQSAQ